jgi:hypothetical protein
MIFNEILSIRKRQICRGNGNGEMYPSHWSFPTRPSVAVRGTPMAGARPPQVAIQIEFSCALGCGLSPSRELEVGRAGNTVEMRVDQSDTGLASEMRVGRECYMR